MIVYMFRLDLPFAYLPSTFVLDNVVASFVFATMIAIVSLLLGASAPTTQPRFTPSLLLTSGTIIQRKDPLTDHTLGET
jgi:hypothetical protein